MRNNKGRTSGLALIMILIAVLIVAYLAVTQMGSLGAGNTEKQMQQEEYVDQAQDTVDSLNHNMQDQYNVIND